MVSFNHGTTTKRGDNEMKNWNFGAMAFAVIAIVTIMALALVACGDDDDDDLATDDGSDGSDMDDDDNTSDDDDNDTTTFGDPPVISNARWNRCDKLPEGSDYEWTGGIDFFMCDPDDNMIGGVAHLYYGFSDVLYLPVQPLGDSFPGVLDCENPQRVSWSWIEFTPDDDGNFYVDLMIKDGVGNESNRIVGIGARDCID